jgi:hypothetical protein
MAAATVFAVLKSISSQHNFPCDTPRRKSVWGRLPPSICLRSIRDRKTGISLASNVLWDREQFHQSRLVGQAIPSSVQYQDTLHQVTNYFLAQGSALAQAHQQAIHWIGQQVQAQASFLGYMDVFWLLMVISLLTVPLALTLRKGKLGGAAPVGH